MSNTISLQKGKLFRRILWICAPIVLIALIIDLIYFYPEKLQKPRSKNQGLQDVVLGMVGNVYVDPQHRFSMNVPEGWKEIQQPEHFPCDVIFVGPDYAELSIQVVPEKNQTLGTLLQKIKHIENKWEADFHLETVNLHGVDTIRRTCRLMTTKLLMFDFIQHGHAYHIQFSVMPEKYDAYQPLILDLVSTFHAPADTSSHVQ